MMVRPTINVIMKNWCVFMLCLLVSVSPLFGQKYFSKTGRISFISNAPLEKIEAHNNNAYVILDAGSGIIECSILIKGFQFEKALMQDHFNENYMESHEFPKGIFKGTVENMSSINLAKDGEYPITVKGNLTLHGVTKPFNATGKVSVKSGAVSAQSSFDILVADYNIQVPKVVKDNVAKNVKVNVAADLQKM